MGDIKDNDMVFFHYQPDWKQPEFILKHHHGALFEDFEVVISWQTMVELIRFAHLDFALFAGFFAGAVPEFSAKLRTKSVKSFQKAFLDLRSLVTEAAHVEGA